MRPFLVATLVLLLAAAGASAQSSAERVLAATLENGLRVLLQEDHRSPVHGEKTIEDFRFQKGVVRYGKLQANGHSHQPCDHQKNESRSDVHQAQFLVINGDDQAVQSINE